MGWLVVFGLNGPLRLYFSLYLAVSQTGGERTEKRQTREKNSKRTRCKSSMFPESLGSPGIESLPSTIAQAEHSLQVPKEYGKLTMGKLVLIGCVGVKRSFEKVFQSYRAVFQREGDREEKN